MALVLTGFTSEIGKSILKKYINDGHKVYCLGRKDESFSGDNININLKKYYHLDFNSNSFENDLENIFEELKEKKIEQIIHAAADSGVRKTFQKLNYHEIDKLIRINFLNSAWFMKKSCDLLASKDESYNKSFIYISTQLAKHVGPGLSIYSSSKAAMNNLCRTLSHEYGPFRIRINIISPGKVADDPYDKNVNIDRMNIPLARLATPNDIVNVVDFLNSKGSSYINGVNVDVNGGR